MVSIREALISLTILLGWASRSLNTLSITESSVAVVSNPQKAVQSLTTKPAPMTSLPLFTVPATSGTCNNDDNSSKSSIDVCGCTCKTMYSQLLKLVLLLRNLTMLIYYAAAWHMYSRSLNQEIRNRIAYQSTTISELTIAPNKNIASNGLPEYFNSQDICYKFFRFL